MQYSGFWRRFGAGLLDHLLVYGVVGIILSLIGTPIFSCQEGYDCIRTVNANGETTGWFNNVNVNWSVWLIFSAWLYFSFFESSKYQSTPGMMVFSMRITNYEKKKISFLRATGRFFASYLSSLVLCIGYIMIAFTPRKQGLHDYLAKTLVVTVK